MMQEGVGCGSPGDTRTSGGGDVFVMKMYFTELGEYEMNNHVVEYEPDRRIGSEPQAGRGHPNAASEASQQARRGQRWSVELTPDGPDATTVTEIYDCSGYRKTSARLSTTAVSGSTA
jgi:hypothetical protein